eukprot:364655-Chlamydomonas_euryale.AAC.2
MLTIHAVHRPHVDRSLLCADGGGWGSTVCWSSRLFSASMGLTRANCVPPDASWVVKSAAKGACPVHLASLLMLAGLSRARAAGHRPFCRSLSLLLIASSHKGSK